MNVGQIIEQLEKLAPVSFAESWDNVGLLVGTRTSNVQRILIALDATDEVIEQAVTLKADLLITHHPMIFSAMKKINDEDFIGRRILKMMQNGISYYAMHTNCDVCVMNDVAADKIDLRADAVLEVTGEDGQGQEVGIGKVGELKEILTLEELAKRVKEAFGIDYVQVTGDKKQKVTRVAISTGAGKSLVSYAIKQKVQVLVTGDIDHHTAIDALAQGVQIIDAGHFGTEHFMVEYVQQYLSEQLDETVKVLQAKEQNPFQII